jgi:type IV pilus assembly protein PilC
MKFSYKALKKDGTEYTWEREAADKFALFRQLKKEGETIISVEEVVDGQTSGFHFALPSFGGIKMHEKITVARNLGNMIEAGLALSKALDVIERQSRNKKLKSILSEVNKSVSEGKSFHQALEAFPDTFNSLFISMVKAGEESGNLSSSLKQVGDQLEKTYLIQKKVKGAMVYPGIILSLMVVIGILMLIFVVPRLTDTFKELNTDLPASTKFVIALSDFFKNHYILALMGILAVFFGFKYFLRTKIGKRIFDTGVLRFPVIGTIIKELNSARTARTLSSLLSSGVDLLPAIDITSEVLQNNFYKEVMSEAHFAVEKGQPLSGIFMKHEYLYPIFVGEMISVGEETGQLSKMLLGVGVFYENEVEQKTKDLSTIVEPMLMIIIGLGVGFFAISMISPMYSVMNNI